jgi:hypothetical protein
MDQNELSLNSFHLEVPSAMPKMISEPIACYAETVHPSCVKINTVSKWIEMSFTWHTSRRSIIGVHPKWFPSLWYAQRKTCTYLALRLTLSLDRPKWASTWPTSPWSWIAQNDLQAWGTMAQTLHLSCTKINTVSKQTKTSFNFTHVT